MTNPHNKNFSFWLCPSRNILGVTDSLTRNFSFDHNSYGKTSWQTGWLANRQTVRQAKTRQSFHKTSVLLRSKNGLWLHYQKILWHYLLEMHFILTLQNTVLEIIVGWAEIQTFAHEEFYLCWNSMHIQNSVHIVL